MKTAAIDESLQNLFSTLLAATSTADESKRLSESFDLIEIEYDTLDQAGTKLISCLFHTFVEIMSERELQNLLFSITESFVARALEDVKAAFELASIPPQPGHSSPQNTTFDLRYAVRRLTAASGLASLARAMIREARRTLPWLE